MAQVVMDTKGQNNDPLNYHEAMYKLIRRISSGFFPRPDRPWSEDATSTAPQIGRKRRLSTPEPEEEREQTPVSKKHRAESEADVTPAPATPEEQPQEKETEEVKEVTKGVKEVELEEKPAQPETSAAEEKEVLTDGKEAEADAEQAAAVPLPDSPLLKAAQSEDADAEGEVDAEGGEQAEETPATVEDADEEVPGLSLGSSSPEKAETTEGGP
ncbi:hypothetical protein BD310DRAFT_945116 [Dichomitus squalens]|uniref:Uncharacterized protein n=1 Tax=Dichomitus squalens TaxID=114155 RepID=A0A4Q9Q939_9APHY|nr:hypothetical protein BD310DRAFT_945116 [Dichomitus squalens]